MRQTPLQTWRGRQVGALFATVSMVVILLFVWTGELQRSARASGIVTLLVVTIFLIVLYALFSHSVYLLDPQADVRWKEAYVAGIRIERSTWVPAARSASFPHAPMQLGHPGSHVALYRFRDWLDPGSGVYVLDMASSEPKYRMAIALFVAAFADLLGKNLIEGQVYTRLSWKLWRDWDEENLLFFKPAAGASPADAVRATGALEGRILEAIKTAAAGEQPGAQVYDAVRGAFSFDFADPPSWPIETVARDLLSLGAMTEEDYSVESS